MSWIEVKATFEKAPADWSPFIDIFGQHGCENTLQTDTPPTLSAAVVEVSGSTDVVEALKQDLKAAGAAEVESRNLVEENWEDYWKRFFKPRHIGKHFVIRPTWEPYTLGPEDKEIVLDPGQAFGTGDHPTTRMCLELLEEFLKPGDKVADIGCGSGILSVGACKLGAGSVVALDIEPLSVEVAKENAILNGVEFHAIVGTGIQGLPEGPYDLIVSNIISATLISISRQVAPWVKVDGYWVVSGIIAQNWPDVLEASKRAGFELVKHLQEDDWVGAALVRVK